MALSDQILSLSPVGYWRFEETSGTTATDAASNHDGAYTNGVGLGTDGIAGNAAEFDGSNDVVLVPHDDAFLLDEGAVHLWFNADDLSGRQGLFSKDASGFGAGGHLSVYLQGDDLVVRLQSTTASNKIILANAVSTGTWYQVAVTWGADGLNVYLDGVLVRTHAYTGGLGASSGGTGNHEPIAIGASLIDSLDESADGVRDFFNGQIDDVAIFGTQLDASAIAGLFDAASEEPSSLIAADDTAATNMHTAIDIDVVGNDSDPDGGTILGVSDIDTSGTLGTVTLNPDGTVNYDPVGAFDALAPGSTATDSFVYTITDSGGDTSSATVTVTVTAPAVGNLVNAIQALSPVSYWRFEEASGTTAADVASDHDGTYTNGVGLGAGGIVSSAAEFDGSNDFVGVAHDPDYLLEEGTVQLWFKADDFVGRQGLFSKDASDFGTGGNMTLYLRDDHLKVQLKDTGEIHAIAAPQTLSVDTWHQAVVSWGAAGLKIYVDGQLENSAAYTGGLGASSGGAGNQEPIAIGASLALSEGIGLDGVRDFFDGEIDDVAVFGTQLSDADIADLFTAGVNDLNDDPNLVQGTENDDVLSGTGGQDILVGLAGSDLMQGFGGDDEFRSGVGRDTLDGGAGSDTASYADAARAVYADLAGGSAVGLARVMPLGDSITVGSIGGDSSGGGYRPKLWDALQNDGISIDFVGSAAGGPSNFEDRDHEGHSGKTIDWIDDRIVGYLESRPADAVLLMIGTNDTGSGDTVETMAAELSGLIDTITTHDPDLMLLVASIPPVNPDLSTPERIALTDAYNALIPGIVADKAGAGLNVTFVDMSVLTTDDINDEVHPTPDGYTKIADVWYQALLDLGVENGTIALNRDGLISIENLIGSAFDDRLAGDDLDNQIQGGSGNDFIEGRAGNDVLSGDDGEDTFHYALGSGHDIITDFTFGVDFLSAGAGVTTESVEEIDTNNDGTLDTVVNLIGDASVTLLGLSGVINPDDLWI